MNDKITVKPDTIFLEDLLANVAKGHYKIPVFQRDFVWEASQMRELFDSILKSYPIGSLLFWKTKAVFHTKTEVGPYRIDGENIEFTYVLDGFQRISTLFGVLMNPKNFNSVDVGDNKSNKFSIFFDVRNESFNFIRENRRKNTNIFSIELYKIYDNRELFNYLRALDKADITEEDKLDYIDRARNLHDILHKFRLPFVEIQGGDIKSAIEIFSRVNSTGTEISEDYILSARSYGETEFNLIDSITQFLNSLDVYNFKDLKRGIILNCIYNAKGKIYFDVKGEELLQPHLEAFTNDSYEHIRKAVDFLYRRLFVIDIRLLPYPNQMIFISEYFRLNQEPTSEQLESLEKWFWITTYSNYFTIYSLSQQRSAYQQFLEFAHVRHPDGIYKVNNDIQFSAAKYPAKINFTSVRTKALQLFYLKSIIGDNSIQEREGIKEFFIDLKNDRKPSNVILRLSSDFESKDKPKSISKFIETSQDDILETHFITQEMVDLYRRNEIDKFLEKRDEYLKSKERQFVAELGIEYIG
ncbi:MAG: DUF262 domain-containing protein [Pseudanabaena sp. ELA607]